MCTLISRAAAIEAIMEQRVKLKGHASPFEINRIVDCLQAVMELPAADAVPARQLKAVAGIALELVGLYENEGCELLWMKNGDDMAQAKESECELHNICHEYRNRIKLLGRLKE